MAQSSGQFGFSLKSLDDSGVLNQVRTDDLQNNGPFQQPMLGLVHSAHPADSKNSRNLVARMVL